METYCANVLQSRGESTKIDMYMEEASKNEEREHIGHIGTTGGHFVPKNGWS